MRWRIASVPHCSWWFMGASVSRSVSSRQEFTDKEAVRQTYPSRATLKTVRKTGSSKAAQQAGGVLVTALSVCVMPCVELRFPFQFCEGSSGWLTVLISTIKGSSQGCCIVLNGLRFMCFYPRAGYRCRFAMKPWSFELRQSLKSKLEGSSLTFIEIQLSKRHPQSIRACACVGPGVRIYIERPSAEDWIDCRCWF